MLSTQIPGKNEDAPQISIDRLKRFIRERMARRDKPEHVANGVRAYFGIALDNDQIIAFCRDSTTPSTLAGLQQDQEVAQTPAAQTVTLAPANPVADPDGVQGRDKATLDTKEKNTPANPDADPDGAVARDRRDVDAKGKNAPSTQTGPRQNQNSMQILGDDVQELILKRIAQGETTAQVIAAVQAQFGIAIDGNQVAICWRDRHERPMSAGRRQRKRAAPLSDGLKEFIVIMLAHYETPSKIALAIKDNFGIEVSRQKIYAYDPAGTVPPAQRWIDLHAATRAKFHRDMAEIGVSHKVVRMQMLNRLAFRCERHSVALALTCLDRAAKECGGWYERRRSPAEEKGPTP